MKIFLSIDDTDNLESLGSGQLSENLALELIGVGLAERCTNITRHQLYVHEAIPYTSHNSSMCFAADIESNRLQAVIQFTQSFLARSAARGSDPGLCVAAEVGALVREALIDFGLLAKQTVLTKDQAYTLAQNAGIHLSEHGGTGGGVIGALAGLGLRLHGSDGRIRGWLPLGDVGQLTSVRELCRHPSVEAVVDDRGNILPENTSVLCTEEKIKTVFLKHRQVVPVTRRDGMAEEMWRTLSRSEVKRF